MIKSGLQFTKTEPDTLKNLFIDYELLEYVRLIITQQQKSAPV